MSVEILTFSFVILVVAPFLSSAFALEKGFKRRVPGKVTLIWVICLIVYYIALFQGGGYLLDKHYPLEVHKENVCEVKVTYSRKGID